MTTKIPFLCSKIQQWLWLRHQSSKQKNSRRTDRVNSNKLFAIWSRRLVGKTCNNSTDLHRPTKTNYPWTKIHWNKLQNSPGDKQTWIWSRNNQNWPKYGRRIVKIMRWPNGWRYKKQQTRSCKAQSPKRLLRQKRRSEEVTSLNLF